jgi:hypothetical protein
VTTIDGDLWLVVHEVRLRGVVPSGEIAEETVAVLVQSGIVRHDARGVRITAEGRDRHTTWARLDVGSDAEAAAQAAYQRFLPLNRELIRVCNDWQVLPGGAPNDHRDARYDWEIIDRLRAVDERAGPLINRLGRTDARFSSYRPRLRSALKRVDNGEHEWVTSPRCASYHTVWMQFHEDVLLAIGGDRASEEPV